MLAQRTCRELKLLRFMEHDNVISLLDLFTAPPRPDADPEIYIVMERMGADLQRYFLPLALHVWNMC